MKRILVPTDFSECAGFAADAAIEIAKVHQAHVHFYSRVHVHPQWKSNDIDTNMKYPESFAKIIQVRNKFQKLKEAYQGTGIEIDTFFGHGDLIQEIDKYAEELPANLIVMGSHGASGIREFMMGSNTQKVARHSECPLMVVKNPIQELSFKKVVFASDFRESALEPFREFVRWMRPFSPEIHLLSVEVPTTFNVPSSIAFRNADPFPEVARPLTCQFHQFVDVDIEEGIVTFAKQVEADLVAICHYGRHPLLRLFTGSISEALVNHLELPVWVLPVKK